MGRVWRLSRVDGKNSTPTSVSSVRYLTRLLIRASVRRTKCVFLRLLVPLTLSASFDEAHSHLRFHLSLCSSFKDLLKSNYAYWQAQQRLRESSLSSSSSAATQNVGSTSSQRNSLPLDSLYSVCPLVGGRRVRSDGHSTSTRDSPLAATTAAHSIV